MNENKNWYAVYTRPRCEKKVAEILTRRKIENYCPINKVVRNWNDRKKFVHEPLFSSYVFARISESEITWLKQSNGVINLVYWLGKPAVIDESEIELMKRFLSEHVNIKIEKTPISVQDKIQVLNSPMMELDGQYLSIKNKTVKVVLPSLGYMMFAEVETANVKVIQHVIPAEINMSYPLYAAK
ncbi:MAG TPA: UpxY family transcription antiterminator [Chitinophagaceae bacterium]|nr:UpxY family transcription antiterminator [Chitinophagaceae bacterium]